LAGSVANDPAERAGALLGKNTGSMNSRNFFAELKRRNVYKVAVAYAVAGWALSQGIAQVFPVFDVPNWVIRLIVVLIIIGFPVAVVFAWAFELTPEGIKRTEVADAMPPSIGYKKHAWIYIVVIGAILSIGLFLLGRYSASRASAAGGVAPSSSISQKSIAVLPFDNLSRDPDNAYFAEGVQDEILTRLAKVADLKVISRTSTQHFKSTPENLPQIAKQLGVTNILEGSVQKAKDQVRVNVQLINALTDAHLWAEIYDRKLTDIFSVESDIAKTIADTLQAKLTGSEQTAMSKKPTENSAAYELYLKGRFFWNKRTGNDLKTAAAYFQRAIDADPSYGSAYAGLAQSYLLIPLFGAGMPRDFFPKASDAARHAIELDETSAEGHAALGNLYCMDDFNPPASEKEFQRAIALDPNYATAHHWFSNSLLVTMGRFDEAIKEGKRAVELDPLSLIINADLGSTLMLSRRYDDAIAQLRSTLALDPNFAYAHWNLGEALYLKGDSTGAIAEYEKAASLDNDPEIQALLARAYAETGKKEQALEILRKLSETAQHQFVRGYLFALIYIGLGDKTTAIQYLERCSQERENIDLNWIKVDPLLDPLRGDPRFEALAEKILPARGFKASAVSK
jgi:TolB-like protein/Tfp pilus assembly protein PilF